MREVASLRYGVIFKKAFCVPEIFNAFVRDVTGVAIEIDNVDTEKSFNPAVGAVDVKFDLYAEDLKNRVIVDIQHERLSDHYDRFLYYGCAAIMEQIANAKNYQPDLTVYTVVVLTSGDKYKKDIFITDMTPKHRDGSEADETHHKIIYLAPKYVNDTTPEPIREWLQAIDDSLDEQVDEQSYERPEIHQIFDIIQKNLVTPQEQAKIIAQNHQEEIKETSHQEGFGEGIEQGTEQGIEQGIEIGKQQGILQTQRQTLIRQLNRKFADIPVAVVATIEDCDDIHQLETWLDAFWDADTLDDMGLTLDA